MLRHETSRLVDTLHKDVISSPIASRSSNVDVSLCFGFGVACVCDFSRFHVSGVLCYCDVHCPHNSSNETCLTRPGGVCFAAVEVIYDSDTKAYEQERSYGCLPPEEAGFMQVRIITIVIDTLFILLTYCLCVFPV